MFHKSFLLNKVLTRTESTSSIFIIWSEVKFWLVEGQSGAYLTFPGGIYRVCQQPEADVGVWEVPGTTGQDDEDAGRLRPSARRNGGQ